MLVTCVASSAPSLQDLTLRLLVAHRHELAEAPPQSLPSELGINGNHKRQEIKTRAKELEPKCSEHMEADGDSAESDKRVMRSCMQEPNLEEADDTYAKLLEEPSSESRHPPPGSGPVPAPARVLGLPPRSRLRPVTRRHSARPLAALAERPRPRGKPAGALDRCFPRVGRSPWGAKSAVQDMPKPSPLALLNYLARPSC